VKLFVLRRTTNEFRGVFIKKNLIIYLERKNVIKKMDKKRLKELREEKAWFDKTMEAKSPEECKKVYASMPKGMLEIKIFIILLFF